MLQPLIINHKIIYDNITIKKVINVNKEANLTDLSSIDLKTKDTNVIKADTPEIITRLYVITYFNGNLLFNKETFKLIILKTAMKTVIIVITFE